MSDLEQLVTTARGLARDGLLDEAIAAFRRVVEIDKQHRHANAFLARTLLARGDAVNAVRHCEIALALDPADLPLHQQLAKAHVALLSSDDAEAKLAAICDELPFAFASLLHRARLRELRGETHAATLDYARALRTAYASGFWHDPDSTPQWLHGAVSHAHTAARNGAAATFDGAVRPILDKYGPAELARVSKCLAMYLGIIPLEIADPRQKPSFLYFPDLPVTPVFERDALAFAESYEAETEAIRTEMLRVLEQGDGIQPFHFDVPEDRRGALTEGAWDAYFFFDEGVRDEAHHAACPHTSSVLARLPLDHVHGHGPEVCYSVLRPGAKILPHRGVTNTRSVLHLGLDVPDGCALHLVGVQEVHWERGRCFAFDDTYEHEAWNRSDRTRVVLLGDIWNPHLREAERAALTEVIPVIGLYNAEVMPR